MHAHGIAHRNPQLSGDAVMYDPTDCYPEGFHPVVTRMNRCFSSEAFSYSRTERPVTYYITGFQTAKRYRIKSASRAPRHRAERRLRWADEVTVMDYPLLWKNNFAPEFTTPEKKCDPFKIDVFLLGAEISRRFFEVRVYPFMFKDEREHDTDSTGPEQAYGGFEWLKPLIDDMCREDPESRITAAEAYVRFLWLSASVKSSDLDGKLISSRKREVTRRVIRKWEKKLHLRALFREIGPGDDSYSPGPSPAMGISWLPVHSV
jgi:hypothetical protein